MKSSLIQTGHPLFRSAQRATISRSPVKESGARLTACSSRYADETFAGFRANLMPCLNGFDRWRDDHAAMGQLRMKHAHRHVGLSEPEGEGQRPCPER
jgi:hypothetical protein